MASIRHPRTEPHSVRPATRPSQPGLHRKALYAGLTCVLFFSLAEASIRLTERFFWKPPGWMSLTPRLIEDIIIPGPRQGMLEIHPELAGYFSNTLSTDVVFSTRPSSGVKRVVILGGSLVKRIRVASLQALANEGKPAQDRLEVLSLGGDGFSSHHVDRLWRELVRKCQVDMVVLAMGNNEFIDSCTLLQRTPHGLDLEVQPPLGVLIRASRFVDAATGLLWRLRYLDEGGLPWLLFLGEEELLASWWSEYSSIGHVPDRPERIAHYRDTLAAVSRDALGRGIQATIVLLPANVSYPPSAFHDPVLGAKEPEDMADYRVMHALDEGDLETAIEVASFVQERRDGPETRRYVQALEEQRNGNMDRARQLFIEARDLDPSPTRVISPLFDAARGVAEELRIPLLDLRVPFERHARRKGWATESRLFEDDCHVNEEGEFLIDRELARFFRDSLKGAPVGLE